MYRLAILTLLLCAAPAPAEDLWLRGGRVWTGDPARPWAESVLVRGNRIAAVDSDAAVGRQAAGARVIPLRGRLVVPGFQDTHLHFLGGSLALGEIDLNGICSLEGMLSEVENFAAAHRGDPWLRGRGWEYVCLPGGRLPRKEDLDRITGSRPAYLAAYDGHTAWVNSRALAMAGIGRNAKYSGFGEIVLDPTTGEPTGVLKEGAMGLVRRLLPPDTPDRKRAAILQGLRYAASLGITSIANANGSAEEVALYDDLARSGELTIRTRFAYSVGPMDGEETLREIAGLPRPAIKIGVDGVIEAYTAAMLAPYANRPDTRGQAAWTEAQITRTVTQADRLGIQVFAHAIGDRAVRMALDAIAAARKANGPRDARHRIEHIETIDPADMPRFAALGVFASMQPIHADPSGIEVWSACIGPERTARGFAWNSLLQRGAPLVFSSDWPASLSLSPIRGIHTAVTRQTPAGQPPRGWLPGERVSVEAALRAYTVHAARSNFAEAETGTIQAGKLADLVVLSQDLFAIPPQRIHATEVILTVFNGRVVHER